MHLHAGESRLLDRGGANAETAHYLFYLGNRQGHRLAKLPARQTQLDR